MSVLKGQKFIGEIFVLDTHNKECIDRVCSLCLYRSRIEKKPDNPADLPDCSMVVRKGEKTAHQLFGFKNDEYLPEIINGKEVGNYCPYFLPYDAD